MLTFWPFVKYTKLYIWVYSYLIARVGRSHDSDLLITRCWPLDLGPTMPHAIEGVRWRPHNAGHRSKDTRLSIAVVVIGFVVVHVPCWFTHSAVGISFHGVVCGESNMRGKSLIVTSSGVHFLVRVNKVQVEVQYSYTRMQCQNLCEHQWNYTKVIGWVYAHLHTQIHVYGRFSFYGGGGGGHNNFCPNSYPKSKQTRGGGSSLFPLKSQIKPLSPYNLKLKCLTKRLMYKFCHNLAKIFIGVEGGPHVPPPPPPTHTHLHLALTPHLMN